MESSRSRPCSNSECTKHRSRPVIKQRARGVRKLCPTSIRILVPSRSMLVLAGRHSIGLLLSDGAGGFGTPRYYSVEGDNPKAVRLADVDLDSHLDLVSSSYSAGVCIRLGHGDDTFGTERVFDFESNEPEALQLADLDDDGRPELIAAWDGGHDLAVSPNLGNPSTCNCAVETFCFSSSNSNGLGARIGWSGSTSLAANDLVL